MPLSAPPLQVVALSGLDDPRLPAGEWNALLASGPSDVVFLRHEWQRAWWETFGRGELLVLAAVRDDRIVCVAPLFVDGGMAYLVGSGGSDYLDVVGPGGPDELRALIGAAFAHVPGLLGVCLYHLPGDSPTPAALRAAGLNVVDEGQLAAPAIDLLADACRERRAAEKRSLVRHERALRRDGELVVHHLTRAEDVRPRLEAFFAEHRLRWRDTEFPSLFEDERQCDFYRRLTAAGDAGGWLRFTVVELDGRPVAHHFGASHAGRFLWYKPSFAIAEARRSPGEVLLRSLLLAAAEEGASCFDFGLGEEAFKARFATHVAQVRTVGIYPE